MSVPNRRGSLPQQVIHERRVIDDCRVCEASKHLDSISHFLPAAL